MPMGMSGQRPYSEYGGQSSPRGASQFNSDLPTDPRMHPGQRHSISEYDLARSHSASNLQNFYASQRYQGRQTEGEQMMQAKRRMAAQRERELRNYHQEQQYNRSMRLVVPLFVFFANLYQAFWPRCPPPSPIAQ